MNVLLLLDSFKGTLTSDEANQIIEDSLHRLHPEIFVKSYCFADGGEGTLSAWKNALKKRCGIQQGVVNGPFPGEKMMVSYGIIDQKTILIESAEIIGLPKVGARKDPALTTTLGIGELIRQSLDEGFRDFILSLGGSSTNDLGSGMAAGLGVRFYHDGVPYLPTGGTLGLCDHIDLSGLDPRLSSSHFLVLSDVTNPLLGKRGATYVYAKQKGGHHLSELEAGMRSMNRLLTIETNQDYSRRKGAGAAGGLGCASLYYLHADIVNGAKAILSAIDYETLLTKTDLVITGEGRIDESSFDGKAISVISSLAKKHHVPVFVIGGSITEEAKEKFSSFGIVSSLSIEQEDLPIEAIKSHASDHLRSRWESYLKQEINCFAS